MRRVSKSPKATSKPTRGERALTPSRASAQVERAGSVKRGGVSPPRRRAPSRPASEPPEAPSAFEAPSSGAPRTSAERIFDAAEELFCERGFDGVSVRDIALRAGVQKALVFYHFATKEELFDAVLSRYYQAHRRALEGALAAPTGVRQRLRGMIDAYLGFMASNARYARLVQAQLSNPATHPLIEKSFTPLYRFVEDTLAELAPREGRASARQLFVTFAGAVISWCTYAPLLSGVWCADPLTGAMLDERRAHLAWLADLIADALARELAPSLGPSPRPRSEVSPRRAGRGPS
jgi:TetR/AcrR family transcriptional regulator